MKKTRRDFLEYLEKKWPGLIEAQELNRSTLYGGPFGYDLWELRKDSVKFLDAKKIFQYDEEWEELKEYTKNWISEYISDGILVSAKILVKPLKEYFKERKNIDWNILKRRYKIEQYGDISKAFYKWDAAGKYKVEVVIEELEDIDRLDTLRDLLKEIQKRDEDFKDYKIKDIEYTV